MKENKKENIVKGISTKDFLENCVGRLSNNSRQRGPLIIFGRLSNIFASEGSPIYLPNLGSKFSRTKSFCFENCIFTRIWLRHV